MREQRVRTGTRLTELGFGAAQLGNLYRETAEQEASDAVDAARSIEGSLERLRVDRIDIVYLHDPDEHWAQASTSGVETLVELRDQGVVSAIGVGMNQSAMPTRFVRETDIDMVMCAGRFTLVDRGALDDLLPAAVDRGVSVVAAAVYNSGLLANPRPRDGARYDYREAPPDLVAAVHRIADAAEPFGLTVPELAARFAVRHGAVASVVVGMRTAAHVTTNTERMAREVPTALWDELDRLGLVPCAESWAGPHTGGNTT